MSARRYTPNPRTQAGAAYIRARAELENCRRENEIIERGWANCSAACARVQTERDNALAELERERAQKKWISVEERLPEIRQDVLTSIGLVGFCAGRATAWYESGAGNGIRGVTHWMPLPELPPSAETTER